MAKKFYVFGDVLTSDKRFLDVVKNRMNGRINFKVFNNKNKAMSYQNRMFGTYK